MLKAPEENCAGFTITYGLKNDSKVQKVGEACVEFYRDANESVALLCRYKEESLQARSSNSPDLEARYRTDAKAHAGDLSRSARKYEQELANMVEYGTKVLQSEVECNQSGTEGAAEGAQILGLAKASLEWERETLQSVKHMLGMFHARMKTIEGNPGAHHEKGAPELYRDSLPAGGERSTSADYLSRVRRKIPADYDPNVTLQGGLFDLAGEASEASVNSLRVLEARGRGALQLILGEGRIALAVSSGLKVITTDKMDGLALTNLGVGVAMAVAGVSYAPSLGVAVASDVIEAQARKHYALKDAETIQPYFDYLKRIPNADSVNAVRGFRGPKDGNKYCLDSESLRNWLVSPEQRRF